MGLSVGLFVLQHKISSVIIIFTLPKIEPDHGGAVRRVMRPTHVPSRSHAFTNVSSAAGTDFRLVVVSPDLTAAI